MKKRTNTGKPRKLLIIIALIIAGILAGTAAFAFYFGMGGDLSGGGNLDNRVSFLLIGTDKRPGADSYNADSIIVVSYDPQTKLVSLLSIPRDTRVTLPGSKKYNKINACQC